MRKPTEQTFDEYTNKRTQRRATREGVIACPYCGYEYKYAEIFIPAYVMDKPIDIERDDKGHIVNWLGRKADHYEEYICDGCGKKFGVSLLVTAVRATKLFTESVDWD